MFVPAAKIAAQIDAIAAVLCALSPGQTATYARLSKAAGVAVSGGSHIVHRAIKQAERESGAVFDNVRGVGYQRLEANETPIVGQKANGRLRRTARRARQRLEGVRANDVTPATIAKLAAYRSHFGMVESMAREANIKAAAKVAEAEVVSIRDVAEGLAQSIKQEL